ncbi:MAG TPA: hypothetical protein VM554_14820 [Acidisarcina sp.]|nr:hypothetical protein [Acidisarcina sp.]
MPFLEQREELQDLPSATISDPRWAAAERIIASRNFAKSGRLSAFLIYIVRSTIENRTEEITEQQIGTHVFGRAPGYNAAEDNIVRTTARQLRQRLALYYQEEGTTDDLRIEVPRGGYLPTFVQTRESHSQDLEIAPLRPPYPLSQEGTVSHSIPSSALFPEKKIRRAWLYCALIIMGAALVLALQSLLSFRHLHSSATDPLWREMFSPGQTVLFVPGDAGLNIFNNQAHSTHEVHLSDYIGGRYLYSPKAQSPEFAGAPLASRRYIAMTDLQLTDRLAEVPRFRRENYQIKFPRGLRPEDFRNANVILSGAPVYNPWDELFDVRLNFHVHYSGEGQSSMYIENRKPLSGELSVYTTDSQKVFGYIAVTDNLDSNGKVLLIEGTSQVGVEATVAFLFNDTKMAPIIAKARRSDGSLSNFEVLLNATSFTNSVIGQTDVIATRFDSRP